MTLDRLLQFMAMMPKTRRWTYFTGTSVQKALGVENITRWLSLEPAIQRIIKQWEVLSSYITKLPLEDKSCEKNDCYKKIEQSIQNPEFHVQLHFWGCISPLFIKLCTLIQTEGLLIHILHDSLSELVRVVMLRFLKPEVVGDKVGEYRLTIDINKADNHLPTADAEIVISANRALQ